MLSLIAAIAKNRAIGKDNHLLWHIPEDFKYFKTLTSGHPIIMGRKTYQSIGKPLPNRTNIIVSRDANYQPDGCIAAHSLEEAIHKATDIDQTEVFIIGGGQIYEQGMTLADRLYLTIVKGDFAGDTFFPEYSQFTKVISRREGKDEKYEYEFVTLERE